MMFHAPHLGLTYFNRYTRYGYRYPYYCYKSSFSKMNSNSDSAGSNYYINRNNSLYSSNNKGVDKYEKNKNKINKTDYNDENNRISEGIIDSSNPPLFQIFGINLYFDDILLICLIWFLYDEGVKDEGLFIALILLLLS